MVEVTGPWWRPLSHGGGHWTMVEVTGPWWRLLAKATFVLRQVCLVAFAGFFVAIAKGTCTSHGTLFREKVRSQERFRTSQ